MITKRGFVFAFVVVQVCLIGVLTLRTRALQAENQELVSQSTAAATSSNTRLELFEKENQRLKADLVGIPALSAKVEQLKKESEEEARRITGVWMERSNAIQIAIQNKRDEIRRLEEWEKEHAKMKMRERAQARLAQKGTVQTPQEAADDYAVLEKALRDIGLRAKRMTEVRQEWRNTDKTPENRSTFQTNMNAAWQELDAAVKKLGADFDLFEELPIDSPELDFSETPLYRSVIPDSRGITATLYLDGTVVWSPPLSSALPR